MEQFFGQNRIVRELQYLVAEIKNHGATFNILLNAPSGYGKTTLALRLINQLGGLQYCYIGGPPDFRFKFIKGRAVFLDEIHLLDNPEFLYKYMDDHVVNFIYATNLAGELKEPLVNRCIVFTFDDYSIEDMDNIVRSTMGSIKLPEEVIRAISEKCKFNPRIAKVLCLRLNYLFANLKIPRTAEELDNLCEQILDLSKDGLNALDRRYLDVLRNANGRASLDLLVNSLHVDKASLLRDVEPHLIYLKKINITSRGRQLV